MLSNGDESIINVKCSENLKGEIKAIFRMNYHDTAANLDEKGFYEIKGNAK